MERRETGFFNALYIFSKLSLKRRINQFTSINTAKKKDLERTATKKRSKPVLFMVFIFSMIMFSSFTTSLNFYHLYTDHLDKQFISLQNPVLVTEMEYSVLKRFLSPENTHTREKMKKFIGYLAAYQAKKELNIPDEEKNWMSRPDCERRAARIKNRYWNLFSTQGIRAFGFERVSRHSGMWPMEPNAWKMKKMISVVLILAFISLFMINLAGKSEHLGEVEWTMQWLYSFPVPTSSLMMIKVFEYSVFSVFQWVMFFPFITWSFIAQGLVWWKSSLLSFICVFLINTTLASARLVFEIWLRLRFSRAVLKNFQAVTTVFGTLALMSTFFLVSGRTVIVSVLDMVEKFPVTALFFPVTFPMFLYDGKLQGVYLFFILVFDFIVLYIALCLSKRLLRHGLIGSPNVMQGERKEVPAEIRAHGSLARGVAGKDLLHLWRDKNHMVQTMFVPLIIVFYNIFIIPDFLKDIMSSFHTVIVFAFFLGGYTHLFGSYQILNIEQQSLWLLYTFPVKIMGMMKQKITMWSLIGLIYPMIVIMSGFWMLDFDYSMVLMTAVLVISLVIFAFLAGFMGVLATDPAETEMAKRMEGGMSMGYLFIMMIFGTSLYLNDLWNILVMMFLLCVLVLALWQRVNDRIPYMLDPVNAPERKINLIDGLVSVFMFFFMQHILGFCVMDFALSGSQKLVLSYLCAGVIVILGLFYTFYRHKVKDVFSSTGVRSPLGRKTLTAYLVKSVVAGFLTGGAGILYLRMLTELDLFSAEKKMFMENMASSASGSFLWVLVLYVLLAPVIEEFIFRGIVYQGFRKSEKAGFSILLSALIFSLVHNQVAMLPVFILGLVTSFFFEKTRWLLPSIIVHMIYNLLVIVYG